MAAQIENVSLFWLFCAFLLNQKKKRDCFSFCFFSKTPLFAEKTPPKTPGFSGRVSTSHRSGRQERRYPKSIIALPLCHAFWLSISSKTKKSTSTRFELAWAEPSRFLIYLLNHVTVGKWQRVRVVKEVDSKSTGLCPREFKSRRCRFFLFAFVLTLQNLSLQFLFVLWAV